MRLSELTASMRDTRIPGVNDNDPVIAGITADSRLVRPGYLFAAMPGDKTDGKKFIEDALQRGAAALLLADDVDVPDVPLVVCGSVRTAFGEVVDAFYHHPSVSLNLIGVTGTNGKTTSAFLLRHLYATAGRKAGMLGTIEYDAGNGGESAPLTTPDTETFTRYLAAMRDNACDTAVVEVSSHALEQERVWPHRFSGAIFTNLSRDHLDYHGDMESYLQAKRRLFSRLDEEAMAVVNIRDAAAVSMVEGCRGWVVGFYLHGDGYGDGAVPAFSGEVAYADVLSSDLGGQRFRVRWAGEDLEFFTPLVGRHNVENCLGCVVMALGQGIGVDRVREAMAGFSGVPGRLERLESVGGIRAFVDFAHTDDALRSVLSVLRPLVKGRLITVFGCGGDRDPGKRPLMARAAETFSDVVVVTSDNPRTEDPDGILDQVMTGFSAANGIVREADRPLAVRKAVAMAGPEDVVVVAGKGHEKYQIVGGEKRHMDDRELIREAFAAAEG